MVRGVGTERTLVTVPATVLGRYYMRHQKLLETDHAETVQLANPSLYCSQTHYRPIIQHEQLSESTKRVHIQLAEDEAMLEMTEDGNARVSTQLLLLTAHSYMNGIILSFNCPPPPPPTHTHTPPTHLYRAGTAARIHRRPRDRIISPPQGGEGLIWKPGGHCEAAHSTVGNSIQG